MIRIITLFLIAIALSTSATAGENLPRWLMDGKMGHEILRGGEHDIETWVARQDFFWVAKQPGVVQISLDTNAADEILRIHRQPHEQLISGQDPEIVPITGGETKEFFVIAGEVVRVFIEDTKQLSITALQTPPPKMSFHIRFVKSGPIILPSASGLARAGTISKVRLTRASNISERLDAHVRQKPTDPIITNFPDTVIFEKGKKETDFAFVAPNSTPSGLYTLELTVGDGPDLKVIGEIRIQIQARTVTPAAGDSLFSPVLISGASGTFLPDLNNATASLDEGDGDLSNADASIWLQWVAPDSGALTTPPGVSVRTVQAPFRDIALQSGDTVVGVTMGFTYLIRLSAETRGTYSWKLFPRGDARRDITKQIEFFGDTMRVPLVRIGGTGTLPIICNDSIEMEFAPGEIRKSIDVPITRFLGWRPFRFVLSQPSEPGSGQQFYIEIPSNEAGVHRHFDGIVQSLAWAQFVPPIAGRFQISVATNSATGWVDLRTGRLRFKADLSSPQTSIPMADGRTAVLTFEKYPERCYAELLLGDEAYAFTFAPSSFGPPAYQTFHATLNSQIYDAPTSPIVGSLRFSRSAVRVVGIMPGNAPFSFSCSRHEDFIPIFAKLGRGSGYIGGSFTPDFTDDVNTYVNGNIQWWRPPLPGGKPQTGFLQDYTMLGAPWHAPLPDEYDPYWNFVLGETAFSIDVEEISHAVLPAEVVNTTLAYQRGGRWVPYFEDPSAISPHSTKTFTYHHSSGFFSGSSRDGRTKWRGYMLRGYGGAGSTNYGLSVKF